MAFRVEYTLRAETDLFEILDWLIAEHAGEAGLRWFEGLEEAISSLAEMPSRCGLAPENDEFSFEIRHLLYGRKPDVYRVVFRVTGDAVYILKIWHGRRQQLTR